MDTKDAIGFVNSLRRSTFRYHSGITDCDDAKDIREYNGNINEVSYKLDRGEKFEKMYQKVKDKIYTVGGSGISSYMYKLETEFFGSSPTTIVVEAEKIHKIIKRVEDAKQGSLLSADSMIDMLQALFLKNKEDC